MRHDIIPFAFAAFFLALGGCQQPDELLSTRNSDAINSFTASFPGDNSMDNSFPAEIDYDSHTITVVFPYNYPLYSDEVVTEEMLKHVRVMANLENNVVIEPPLLFMDLTVENRITVKDYSARKEDVFTVVAEIRKSAECLLSTFNISSLGLSGVINDNDGTVSFVTIDPLGILTLEASDVSCSHGATIVPDPTRTALDYDQVQTFTVIAQNGIDRREYTVQKSVPPKTELGIRARSGTLLWVKKLSEIEGITTPLNVTSLAVTEDEVVLNENGNPAPVILNLKTGAVSGTMDLSGFAADNVNYSVTSDEAGHLLFCNYTPGGGSTFTVWKASSTGEIPQKYIEHRIEGASTRYGWHLSVRGNLDTDAFITTPVAYFSASNPVMFARWQVKDGVLLSQDPDLVTVPDERIGNGNWSRWFDVVCESPTDPEGDYFLVHHGRDKADNKRYLYWIGLSGVKGTCPGENTSNTVMSAVDYCLFNHASYLVYNYVNPFTWGVTPSDAVNMYDITSGSPSSKIDVCPSRIYGGVANGAANTEGTGDVMFRVSQNGYFLYVCFVFSNGCVGCVQFDCLDI